MDTKNRAESDVAFERLCQEHTRKLVAQSLDGETAIDLVRSMLASSEGEFLERPLDLHPLFVRLRNTVRRQADELGEMRARERERGSELERRQASQITDLHRALELAREEMRRLRALLDVAEFARSNP